MTMRPVLGALGVALVLWCCDVDVQESPHPSEPDTATHSAPEASEQPNGEHLYDAHCLGCHGVEAEGTDICVSLITPHINMQSDGKLFVMIKSGTGGQMPAFGDVMSDDEIVAVIGYLRSIQSEDSHRDESDGAGR
ncbi:MAG: c-type cytochrome [Myxococcota bacterium]